MANPLNLVDHYEQALQEVQKAVGDLIVAAEREKDINRYLSEKLTESHRYNGTVIRDRDEYQVKYEVLREVCLAHLAANGWEPLLNSYRRMREVLGLTTEEENQTHDYQTGWAEDGPIPDGETNF